MKIKKITYRLARDFEAIFECEFCGENCEKVGYDDDYFHNHVIPRMVCKSCGIATIEIRNSEVSA